MQRDTSVRRRPAGALPAGPRGRCPRSGRASTHRGSGRQAPRAPGEICYRPRPRTSEGTPSRWCPPLAHPAKGPPMASAAPKIPSGGEPITLRNGRLQVPEKPILPFIEGDGTGPDIWRASRGALAAPGRRAYGGIRSLNVALRQMLDLFVCLRPVRWFKGVPSPVKHPEKVDMVIFRENTED